MKKLSGPIIAIRVAFVRVVIVQYKRLVLHVQISILHVQFSVLHVQTPLLSRNPHRLNATPHEPPLSINTAGFVIIK